MTNDEEIQSFVKSIYGEPPESIGSMVGTRIDKTLSHESLYYLLWWFINDMDLTRKNHQDQVSFLMEL